MPFRPIRKNMNRKQHLIQGFKYLAFSLVLLVTTTYILTFAFLNKETLPIYLLLPLGLAGVVATIYMMFRGLKRLSEAFFGR